jgi:uncharacterized repeat protein (TIGR01451 family)
MSLLLVALATPALAGVNSWTPVGPDGGAVRAVAFHPSQPGVMFAAASYSIYRSSDSGQTWAQVRDGVPNSPTRIVVDPTNGNRIMTSGVATLFRSDDGGLTFNPTLGPTANRNIATLTIAPDGSAVYVATYPGSVFRSGDFGATWVERSTGLPTNDTVRDLVVDPRSTNTLYAITTSSGLYRSIDAGLNWNQLANAPNVPMFKIAVDPGDSNQLLLAAYGGLYSSPDAGTTWVLDPLAGNYFVWVGYHPSPTSRVGAAVAIGANGLGPTLRRSSRNDPWVAGATLKIIAEDAAFDPLSTDVVNSTLLVASPEGPLYTQNGGASYVVRSQGIRAAAAILAATTDDPQGTIYAAFTSGPIGILRRTASGWLPVDNTELRNAVPFAFQPIALAVDPHQGDTVFVSANASLLRSLDGGQSWSPPHPTFSGVLPRSIAFAPSNSQIMYLGADGQGAYYTDDQGVTWLPRATGLPSSIGAIAVDSQNPNIAYAGDRLGPNAPVIFKTTNGGTNWAPASTGLSVQAISAIAVTPSANGPVYAGGGGNGEGLFTSTDAGATWTRVGAPIGDAPGISIAIDPIVTTNVVMALNSIGMGAARSVDAGATWDELHFPAAPGSFPHIIRQVVVDPLRPHVIIGSASDYGLVEFEVAPDLELTLTSAPAALPLDGSGAATLRVTNRGPFAASAVKLTLTPPAGTTAPAGGNCTQVGAGLECALRAIRLNESVDTTVTLLAGNTPAAGTLAASVVAHEPDPALANNSARAAIATRRIANLGVTLAASAAAVDRGTALELTATATNAGPNAATAAQLVVTLGTGLAYRSSSATQGACAENAGVVTCALGQLSSGSQAVVRVDVTAASVGSLMPTAAISDDLLDPVAANNTAAATVTSRPVADVGVQITDLADPAISGQSLQYTATVSNAGPDDVPGSTVTINVTGATVIGATTDRGSCTAGGTTVSCSLTAMASGASAAIQIQGTAGAAGTASATATVAGQGTDPSAANNTASQSTTINDPPRSGGGGGSGGIELLCLLVALLGSGLARRRRFIA